VQQSTALLVADGTASLLDETARVRPAATTASAADMEALVSKSDLDWVILRSGALYGPDTGRDDRWRQLARSGDLRLPADGSAYISLIHVTDMAEAIVLGATSALSRAIFSIVDDEPVTYSTLFCHIATIEHGPEPQPGGPLHPSFRISNARARAKLGWVPRIATYCAGLV
jgi:nucleoside-diphosphate-sugar epimerase